jgi:hypothetical protein
MIMGKYLLKSNPSNLVELFDGVTTLMGSANRCKINFDISQTFCQKQVDIGLVHVG